MNCVKCGRPIESSGHLCGYPPYTTNSVSTTDEAIWKLTQQIVLYNDMVEELRYLYTKLTSEHFSNDAIDVLMLLDRAEKLK